MQNNAHYAKTLKTRQQEQKSEEQRARLQKRRKWERTNTKREAV